MMSSRALRYFLAVVSAGSMRGAGEVLNVAASAVSRQVAELEAELGQSLLERRADGVAPTEAGRLVAKYAQWEADERERLQLRLGTTPGTLKPERVTIHCGTGFLGDLLDNGLAGFAAVHPSVDFLVQDGGTDEIQAAILEGIADIGLAYSPQPHASLAFVARARQPLVALVAPGHPAATRATVTSLRGFMLDASALLPAGHGIRGLLAEAEKAGRFRLHVKLESPSIELLRHFVAAGLGVTFLPRFTASMELAAGRLVAVDLTERRLAAASAALLVRRDLEKPAAVSVAAWLAKHMMAFRKAPDASHVDVVSTKTSRAARNASPAAGTPQ